MKTKKEDRGKVTRREFLSLSAAGVAGMALTGIPERSHGGGKEGEVRRKITRGRKIRLCRAGRSYRREKFPMTWPGRDTSLHSQEIGTNNWSQYSNQELDGLLVKGRTAWKWEDRVPIYKKVVEIIKEELPILYLAKTVIPIAHRDYVKGHEFGASTWFGYHGGGMKRVWLDK